MTREGGSASPPTRAADLLCRSKAELDQLYRNSAPGPMPDGEVRGTAIAWPGTICARIVDCFTRTFLWQGKVFDASSGRLVNRISPFSVKSIDATLRTEPSWLDGRPCHVIDYSRSGWKVARPIRDEIREVAPGLWLGKVWFGKKRLVDFTVATRFEAPTNFARRLVASAATLLLLFALYLGVRLTRDLPVVHADPAEHFKYGSTGGERDAGIPLPIFRLLPELFPEHLPGPGLASLGFVYEPGHELPVGFSQRNVQGIDRVFVNCAVCHVGTFRMTPEEPHHVVVGMPSNTLDLGAFERFLFRCVADEEFTPERIAVELGARGADDWINRLLYRLVGVERMRSRLLTIADRFRFLDLEPESGPGRVDTFNPPKALLRFPLEKLLPGERIGNCDFPSVWNQAQREGMQLHWDGNNTSVSERNRSAAFGTGATPATLDRASMGRIEAWLKSDAARPPKFPGAIDATRAERGRQLYGEYCASCHGKSGSDFGGERVGKVTPIGEIGTDRWRLDSYTPELCANQNLLYAAYPAERFKSFRKTFGYANQPLDGVWLRAPYLHNGSVATLRELLNPSRTADPESGRRRKFFRGCDLYDAKRMGFVADLETEPGIGRRYFEFDTTRPGNGNAGHEGKAYGTELPDADKDALVEYLKSF